MARAHPASAALLPPLAAGASVLEWSAARLLSDVALSVGADGLVQVAPAAEAPAARPVPPTGRAPETELALVFRHPEGLGRPHAFAEVLLATLVPNDNIWRICARRESMSDARHGRSLG